MSKNISQFWEHFNAQCFNDASECLNKLTLTEQSAMLEELFQKSEYHRAPFILSVFRAKLKEGETFNDFHQAWYPEAKTCDPIETKGQKFAQHFPVPMRVLNAVNIANPNDVLTVGIGWVRSKEEEQSFTQYMEQTMQGKHTNDRRTKNAEVSDRSMLGMFRLLTDDNLGTPFKGNYTAESHDAIEKLLTSVMNPK